MAGVALLVLVLGVLLGWWLLSARGNAQTLAASQASASARLLEHRVLSTTREVDLLLDDLARSVATLPLEPPIEWSEPLGFETIMLLRDKPGRLPHVVALSVLDTHGKVAYSSLASPSVNLASQPHIAALLADPRPRLRISAPHRLADTGHEGVAMARPVLDARGHLLAIVEAQIHIEAWSAHFADLDLGEHGTAFVADREGRLLALAPLPDRRLIGQRSGGRLLGPSGLHDDTYYALSGQDGRRRLVALRRLADYPFSLGVALSEDDYLATWRLMVTVAVAGFAFILMLGAGLWLLLWRSGQQAQALLASQARLEAQERHMRHIVEATPCALALVGLVSDRIVYLNRDMAELFGQPAATLDGRPLADYFVRPAEWQACRTALVELRRVRELELAVQCGAEGERWVRLAATLVDGRDDEQGEGMRADELVLVSLVDVTSRVAREQQLNQAAGTDPLTGLANRRRFDERGAEMVELALRHQRPLSLLMIDLDHFKLVNDQYGHAVGDEVLVRMARLLEVTLRTGDLPVRLGGEEFVALLPETDAGQAREAAERIREAVENAPLMLADSRLVVFTVSIGVATLVEGGSALTKLLGSADAALYRAKRSGRNRVAP